MDHEKIHLTEQQLNDRFPKKNGQYFWIFLDQTLDDLKDKKINIHTAHTKIWQAYKDSLVNEYKRIEFEKEIAINAGIEFYKE